MSKINNISSKLRSRHLQSLYSVTYYCLAPLFQYWLQHCYPEDVREAATTVDAGISSVAARCISEAVRTDGLTLRRLRLPARKFGGGLRSLVDVAPAAFLGTVCKVLPHFVDRRLPNGEHQIGFLPRLAGIFDPHSFDEGNEDIRFQHFLQSGTRLAMALAMHWVTLQNEVGADSVGPLRMSVEAAGADSSKLQRDITMQRERVRFQALDVEIRALPEGDMRKAAWLNVDRFSTCWVTAWPTHDARLSNEEFTEATTFYFGLPSPACAAVIGERIGSTRYAVDAHGCHLTTATLPGDGWRSQHDALKWQIDDCRDSHTRVVTEVYGLFAAYIPQAGRRRLASEPIRKRQGLVPDFLVYAAIDGPERALLLELKTLHHGVSTYVQGQPPQARCAAVARRARALPAEYAAKAVQVDRKYCNTGADETGPVTARLQRFEPVRGLVFGAWAECSPDVEKLLGCLARTGAARLWRSMGCVEESVAVGILAWALRRRWAMTALRENARLKLERLGYLGHGASEASQRRTSARAAWAARQAARAAGTLAHTTAWRGDR